MSRLTQLDALKFWFEDYETINLAQAKAGLPSPNPGEPKVFIERVAPLIHTLRNEGWVITTANDAAGNAYYQVVSKPSVPGPGHPDRVTKVPTPPAKSNPLWMCTKPGCLSGVVPDQKTTFDGRYTTGKCFTHGKVVLVRR
jgi:hypothetical protein